MLLEGDEHTSVTMDRLSDLHVPTHLRPSRGLWRGQQAQLASSYSLEEC